MKIVYHKCDVAFDHKNFKEVALNLFVTMSDNVLMINAHVPAILASIQKNLVTQVNAATGSGKSIGIPEALAKSGLRVFVSVPTRVAAVSLCGYLQSRNPTLRVGFAADGQAVYDRYSNVVYATSGHIRRKNMSLFEKGEFKDQTGMMYCDVLILDETHTGSMDNTMILSSWLYARKLKREVPKLVFLSATPSRMPVQPEPVVCDVPVPTPFALKIEYYPVDHDDEEDIFKHAANIAMECHETEPVGAHILIFVPGSREAEEVVGILRNSEDLADAEVLPVYAALDRDDIDKIYEPMAPEYIRRIFVATNIMETSITVDGVSVVIDSMMCKEAVASPSGATRLSTTKITKDSAKQRAGRTGRTRPGKCIRLISEYAYEELDEHRVPEVDRLPLHTCTMEFMKAHINPVENIAGANPIRVYESIYLLRRLNLVVDLGEYNEDGSVAYEVQPAGYFVPTVPLGVHNATFLYHWIQAGYPVYPGIVVACIIDVYNNGYFFIPRKHRDESDADYSDRCDIHIDRYFRKWFGETPVHTFLNMWHDLELHLGHMLYRLVDAPHTVNYRRWSRENSLNYRQLTDLTSIISQTYKSVRSTSDRQLDVNVAPLDAVVVMSCAIPWLQAVYASNDLTPCYGRLPCKDGIYYNLDNRRAISHIERFGLDSTILYMATHEIIAKSGRHIAFVDLFISIRAVMPLPFPEIQEEEVQDEKVQDEVQEVQEVQAAVQDEEDEDAILARMAHQAQIRTGQAPKAQPKNQPKRVTDVIARMPKAQQPQATTQTKQQPQATTQTKQQPQATTQATTQTRRNTQRGGVISRLPPGRR